MIVCTSKLGVPGEAQINEDNTETGSDVESTTGLHKTLGYVLKVQLRFSHQNWSLYHFFLVEVSSLAISITDNKLKCCLQIKIRAPSGAQIMQFTS